MFSLQLLLVFTSRLIDNNQMNNNVIILYCRSGGLESDLVRVV